MYSICGDTHLTDVSTKRIFISGGVLQTHFTTIHKYSSCCSSFNTKKIVGSVNKTQR